MHHIIYLWKYLDQSIARCLRYQSYYSNFQNIFDDIHPKSIVGVSSPDFLGFVFHRTDFHKYLDNNVTMPRKDRSYLMLVDDRMSLMAFTLSSSIYIHLSDMICLMFLKLSCLNCVLLGFNYMLFAVNRRNSL